MNLSVRVGVPAKSLEKLPTVSIFYLVVLFHIKVQTTSSVSSGLESNCISFVAEGEASHHFSVKNRLPIGVMRD